MSTIIDIEPSVPGMDTDCNSPYYKRSLLDFSIQSTTRYDRVSVMHLGFHAYAIEQHQIRLRSSRYTTAVLLETEVSALVEIVPFQLCLANIGDGLMKVGIRMMDGLNHCNITILQEKYQPKALKFVHDFIEYEGMWYASTLINCLQTIRIEEGV